MKRLLCLWGATVLGIMVASPALAQLAIVSSTPPPDAELDQAPPEVTLELREAASGDSNVRVLRCGRPVSGGALVFGRRIEVPLRERDDGVYEVRYRLLPAGEGRPRDGSFAFSVGEGAEACSARREAPGIWDIPLGDFALALGIAALIGAAGGHVYAGIMRGT